MNKKLLETLINWNKPYITRIGIGVLLDKTPDACDAIIRRAILSGYLLRIKRGIFLITKKAGADIPDTFEIAQLVYGPSHISFESALSFHSWIPEGVRVTTSATSKTPKEFSTPIGPFSFERIPYQSFSLGVKHIKTDVSSYLMADPWKAIADMIYVRKKAWPNLAHITEDLRVEEEDFKESDLNVLEVLALEYNSKYVRTLLKKYYMELRN